jgi:hypothetical protein
VSTEDWTAESLARSLSALRASGLSLKPDDGDGRLEPYLRAAAVLVSFDPDVLRPAGPAKLKHTEAVAQLLLQSVATESDNDHPRWMLRTEARRSALERLGTREAMQEARQCNKERDAGLQQEVLDALIDGRSRALSEQSREELTCTLQAVGWLHGVLDGVPEPRDVRAALNRATILSPFHDLAAHFLGRERELRALRAHVDVLQTSSKVEAVGRALRAGSPRVPLVIDGVGGIGKSTLVAKFILDHASSVDAAELAFVYIDYDRPGLLPYEPTTVLVEAAQQLAVQGHGSTWEELSARLSSLLASAGHARGRRPGSELVRLRSVVDRETRSQFIDEFAGTFHSSDLRELPLLLVLDTFEQVQHFGSEVVQEVGTFLAELAAGVRQLRVVIAGRAPVDEFVNQELHLGAFDDDAAVGYLLARGIDDETVARNLVDRLTGNPLTLQLAVRAIARDRRELENIQTLRRQRRLRFVPFVSIPFLSVDHEEIQGYLYRRILDHVRSDAVRGLVHPGLVLRRVSPDLIQQVLADACGISVPTRADAQRLFDELRQEVTLVRMAGSTELEHRADVRRVMLPLIHSDNPSAAERIHRGAVAYYAARNSVEDRAEEIYHRLFVDDLRQEIDARWESGVDTLLAAALDELPPAGQAYLSPRVGREPRDKSVWERADAETRARRLQDRVADLLGLGRPGDALALIRQVGTGVGARLRILEAMARRDLGDLEGAQRAVTSGLTSLSGFDAGASMIDLLALAAEIQCDSGALEAAHRSAVDAYRTARHAGDVRRQLEVAVDRLALARRAISDSNALRLEFDQVDVDAGRLSDGALRENLRPACALAGELGAERPDLVWRLIQGGMLAEVSDRTEAIGAGGAGSIAAGLRVADPDVNAARRLASAVSVSIQWPDAEVRADDKIAFDERESIWVVYVTNSGDERIWDVEVHLALTRLRTFTLGLDSIERRGRRWYILPRDSGMYDEPGALPIHKRVEFTARLRRFSLERGRVSELRGRLPDHDDPLVEQIEFSSSASREVATLARAWIDRPDDEVRAADQLGPDENWWVLYLTIDGDRPVDHVVATVTGDDGRSARFGFPPVEPGRRRWWILRPDTPFDPSAPAPTVLFDFQALGHNWRRDGERLLSVTDP